MYRGRGEFGARPRRSHRTLFIAVFLLITHYLMNSHNLTPIVTVIHAFVCPRWTVTTRRRNTKRYNTEGRTILLGAQPNHSLHAT